MRLPMRHWAERPRAEDLKGPRISRIRRILFRNQESRNFRNAGAARFLSSCFPYYQSFLFARFVGFAVPIMNFLEAWRLESAATVFRP
jgi:hypothetical protein